MTPTFKNKPNEHFQFRYEDGKGNNLNGDYWISRAPALVGIVIASCSDLVGINNERAQYNLLITRRSINMRDEPSKYCAPCGYLDWNESGYDAIVREIYEETSLYIPDYEKYMFFDNYKQPWFVQTDPTKDKRQNVSLNYLFIMDFKADVDAFPLFVEKYKCKEVDEVKWVSLYDFYATERSWAFNHPEIIKKSLVYFNHGVSKVTYEGL